MPPPTAPTTSYGSSPAAGWSCCGCPPARARPRRRTRSRPHLRGDIIVNTDATIRIPPDALKPLIRVFQDPTIGVASGRDISVGRLDVEANRGESGYVGYEMWLRVAGDAGRLHRGRERLLLRHPASAGQRDLPRGAEPRLRVAAPRPAARVPNRLGGPGGVPGARARRRSRRSTGGRSGPWPGDSKRSGISGDLMNPLRYGSFAWMLVSHKLCRWLVHLTLPLALLGLALLAPAYPAGGACCWCARRWCSRWVGSCSAVRGPRGFRPRWRWPDSSWPSTWLRSPRGGRRFRGERNPIWEPTRRPGSVTAPGPELASPLRPPPAPRGRPAPRGAGPLRRVRDAARAEPGDRQPQQHATLERRHDHRLDGRRIVRPAGVHAHRRAKLQIVEHEEREPADQEERQQAADRRDGGERRCADAASRTRPR